MAEFTASHFSNLCSQAPVQEQIGTIEARRKAAVSKFWMVLVPGLIAAVIVSLLVGQSIGGVFGWILLFIIGTIVVMLAWNPLAAASESIKHPTLHALAAQGGMTYMPAGFEPPVLAEAKRALFGSWLSHSGFTDLIYGQDQDGRNFAFYEGTLSQGHGKHKTQVFSGQFYAFQRRNSQRGQIVAVPDRGLFNFFKPSGGFQRLRFEPDPEFEKRFEVYATDPQEAWALFGSMALRQLLLQLRANGRIFVYIGPTDVLACVTGPNRFEPGSMFKSHGGEERVRLMFNDVCASLDVLNRLKAVLA